MGNCDDNAVPHMKMMHQSRTCERNSWTTTGMVLANLYPQILQLNLCLIFLGYFALKNIPRTIYSFNQKKEEDDQDSGQKMVRSANEIKTKDAWCCSKCNLEDRSKEILSNQFYHTCWLVFTLSVSSSIPFAAPVISTAGSSIVY